MTALVKPNVQLKSRSEAIKWPRYEVKLERDLTRKAATKAAADALRTSPRQILLFSQFSYDASTGLVDTRVKRENY